MKKVVAVVAALAILAAVCSAQTNTVSLAQTHVAGVNLQTGTSYSILAGDRSKLVSFSNASAVAVTLPQAGTTGFPAGFMFWAQSIGAGTTTITPTTSTIDGQSSLALTQYQGTWIVSNGTNWYSDRGVGQSGTLSEGSGGTNATSYTLHGVIVQTNSTTFGSTGAGTNGQCLLSNGGSSDPTFQTCANASVSAPYFRSMTKNGPREDLYIAQGATGGVDVLGQTIGLSASATTRSFGDSTNPPYTQIATSTTNQNLASWTTNKVYNQGHNLHVTARVRFSATTNVRSFIGLSDNANLTDTNNGFNIIGFSYSTLRGDTNWQCATNNASSAEADAASPSIAPDTNWHTFEVIATDATPAYDFYIDGVHACSQSTTKIPSSNTLLWFAAVTVCQVCSPTANNVRLTMYSTSMDW